MDGWTLTSASLVDGEYEIRARCDVEPDACIKCGVVGRLYKHGTKVTTYRDSPIRGHTVQLQVDVRRYKCRDCGGTFLQPLTGILGDRLMTERCAEFMWRPYRDLAREFFPGVPVVIDKFHVVRMANYCMERVRIRLGKAKVKGLRRHAVRSRHVLNKREAALSEHQRWTRDIWLANEPEMKTAYDLKEAFYAIYRMPKAKAVVAFDAFPATVPQELRRDFRVLLTAMRNWRTEILAFFDHPITNAYTEAVNGVAKTINRAGRGYTFEVLRARLLFRPHAGRPIPPDDPRTPLVKPLPAGAPIGSPLARCESCGGLYHFKIVASEHIPAVGARERLRVMKVCRPCHLRFR